MELISKEFQLDKHRYFFIVMRKHLRKRIWFIFLIWCFAIGLAFVRMNFITVLLILYGIGYPIIVFYFLRKRFQANINPAVFKKRFFVLKSGVLETHFDDGSVTNTQLKDIFRIYKKRKYSMVYINKHSFVYIPIEAFHSKKEYNEFLLALIH